MSCQTQGCNLILSQLVRSEMYRFARDLVQWRVSSFPLRIPACSVCSLPFRWFFGSTGPPNLSVSHHQTSSPITSSNFSLFLPFFWDPYYKVTNVVSFTLSGIHILLAYVATPALSSLLLNYEPITSSSSLCLIAKYHHYDSSWGKKELHHIAIKYGGGGRIDWLFCMVINKSHYF